MGFVRVFVCAATVEDNGGRFVNVAIVWCKWAAISGSVLKLGESYTVRVSLRSTSVGVEVCKERSGRGTGCAMEMGQRQRRQNTSKGAKGAIVATGVVRPWRSISSATEGATADIYGESVAVQHDTGKLRLSQVRL